MTKIKPISHSNSFFEYLFWILNVTILHFWKMFFFVFFASVIAIVTVLVITPEYKSEALIYIPTEQKSLLGGTLGKMAGNLALADFNLGGESTDRDLVLTLLDTKDFYEGIVNEFDLINANQIDTTDITWFTSLLKYLKENIIVELTDEDAIILGYKDTSYVRAYGITNYMVKTVDSMYTAINHAQNEKNRAFYQGRLTNTENNLNKISDSLVAFSKEKNILDIDVQMEQSIIQIAELEGKARWLKIEINALRKTPNVSTTMIETKQSQLNQVQRELDKIKRGEGNSLILSNNNINRDIETYYKLYREFKIQESLYQFLRQNLEEKLLNEEKKFGNILVIQEAWINKKRVSPPRSAIVISTFLLSILFSITVAVAVENYRINREGNIAQLMRDIKQNFLQTVLRKQ